MGKLAHVLEKLLDTKPYSPQTQALLGLLVIGGALWFVLSRPRPNHTAEIKTLEQAALRGVIWRRQLTPRRQYEIRVKSLGTHRDTIDFSSFYEEKTYKKLVGAAKMVWTNEQARASSLPVLAREGDSLIKKKGQQTIRLVRGGRSFTFYYDCPYHPSIL